MDANVVQSRLEELAEADKIATRGQIERILREHLPSILVWPGMDQIISTQATAIVKLFEARGAFKV